MPPGAPQSWAVRESWSPTPAAGPGRAASPSQSALPTALGPTERPRKSSNLLAAVPRTRAPPPPTQAPGELPAILGGMGRQARSCQEGEPGVLRELQAALPLPSSSAIQFTTASVSAVPLQEKPVPTPKVIEVERITREGRGLSPTLTGGDSCEGWPGGCREHLRWSLNGGE